MAKPVVEVARFAAEHEALVGDLIEVRAAGLHLDVEQPPVGAPVVRAFHVDIDPEVRQLGFSRIPPEFADELRSDLLDAEPP